MNEENRDVKIDPGDVAVAPSPVASADTDRTKRLRLWVNWALAALTVVGAGFVMVYFFGAVMSTAACSQKQCQHVGPTWLSPDVSFYGPPVVAVVTVILSFFTAPRRWGIVIPLVALALLGADIAILAATVAQ
jgi:hypothetical protein